jgi:hypothetical protein
MHPLGPELSGLSDDELNKKYSELQKRYTQCWRSGPQSVIPQIQMLLSDYQAEISRRNQKVMDEMMKKAEQRGKGFGGVIDIS